METAEKGRAPDWKELFYWGVRLPVGHPLRTRYPDRYPEPVVPDDLVPGIGMLLTELHARMLGFQQQVAGTVAAALGVPATYFADLLEDGPVVNRATAAGLQVLGDDGGWIAADAPAGRAVVNVQFCHPAPWTVLVPVTGPGAGTASLQQVLTADAPFPRTMYRINRIDAARRAEVAS